MMCIECYGETSPWLLEIRMNQLAEIYISCSGYSPVFFRRNVAQKQSNQNAIHRVEMDRFSIFSIKFKNALIEFHDSWDVQAISFHPQNIIVITIFRHVFQFPMKLLQTIQFHGTHRVRGKYVDSTSTAANNCLSIAIRLNFQRRTTHILIDISSFHWMWSAWNATEIGWKFSEQWIKKKSIFFSTPMGFWTVSAVNRCE